MKKSLKIIQILILFAVFSCSSKEKDFAGAVSVFSSSKDLEIDNSLQKQNVNIPPQKNSKESSKDRAKSNDSSKANNLEIENFAFAPKITKSKSIWFGFRFGGDNDKIFKPAISDNISYLLDYKGNLTARNLETHKKIWQSKIFDKKDQKDVANGKVYLSDGKVFVTSGFNYVAAINALDGKMIWSKKIGSIPISAPVSSGEQVFVITSDNKTYALNAENGSINWIHDGIFKNTAILGSADPVFYKNYVISSYSSGEVYILDQKTGEAGWSQNLNINKAVNSDFILNDVDSTPIVKNGVAYTIGNGGLMLSINIENGAILWQKELASISDFWVAGDFIYLINNENQLICLKADNGGIKWYKDLETEDTKNEVIYYGLIMAGDNLILSNSRNEILLFNPNNGEMVQKKKFHRDIYSVPIIYDGKLYISTLGYFTINLLEIR